MRGQVIKLGGRAFLAAILVIAAIETVAAVEIPDGDWEGSWDPANSCRDTRKRRVTARTEGGHIRGEVHNPPAGPGVFAADIKPNGRFTSTVAGLKRFGFSVNGRATPSEIRATWEGRDDCGNGNFVLSRLPDQEDVGKQDEAPSEPAAPAAVQPDPVPQANPPQTEPATEEPDAARAALDTLHKKGVITDEEYQAKLKALEPEAPAMIMAPSDLPPPDPRLRELDDLVSSGAISADEYLKRRRAITGNR